MVFQRASATEFILLLPDEATTLRVLDGGRTVISPPLRLHITRWTRLFRSSGVAVADPVDVEIGGIPAHAWDMESAVLLLDEFCLVGEVAADTQDHRDVFRLRAWSSQPELIPEAMELFVEEPHVGVDDGAARALSYPVIISTALSSPPAVTGLPQPPPPANNDSRRRQWRRRHTPLANDSSAGPSAVAAPTRGPARVPVHSRLGTGHHARVDGETARDSADWASPLGCDCSGAGHEDLEGAAVNTAPERGLVVTARAMVLCRPSEASPLARSTIGPSACWHGPDPSSRPVVEPMFGAPLGLVVPARDVPMPGASQAPTTPTSARSDAPPTAASPPPLAADYPEWGGLPSSAAPLAEDDLAGMASPPAACLSEEATPVIPLQASSPDLAVGQPKVYSRRRCRQTLATSPQAAPSPLLVPPPAPPSPAPPSPPAVSPTSVARHELISKITRPIDSILQLPCVPKRRSKTRPPCSVPRRSRRVAGVGPCSPGPVISEAQKRVIRSLGFPVVNEHIDADTQDQYSKLFCNPISDSQLVALAAIFGWTVEDGLEVRLAAPLEGL
ncbi:hypothetical protein BS78_K193800 [Paspalum vaginatum]|uniref:DUF4283 domain-containing protein n=1 Tax=Paspalum vaginatum TaxID=158149 RepID=A0A9W7XBU4_9POAL|nr:hypothetical protein BS78_K193800 [Paspalum vaginatum]